MNLITELGPRYIREHLVGALVRLPGNKVGYIRGCDERVLNVATIDLTKSEYAWNNEDVPHDVLKTFKDIAWPRLGYRNLESESIFGNVVTYITCDRSVHRGLREDLLSYGYPEVYNAMYWGGLHSLPAADPLYRTAQIFDPKWISFKDGLRRIKAREIPAFAMNEDMAIAASVDQGPNRWCDLLHRNRVIGSVSESGSMMLHNVTLKKSSMKRLQKLMES